MKKEKKRSEVRKEKEIVIARNTLKKNPKDKNLNTYSVLI